MADFGDEIFFSSAAELNRHLREKRFSAGELARAFAERLEKLGPSYNALALSLKSDAIRRASDVDAELKRGRFRGPLQGVPFGAKDLLAVANRPTTWGAKPFAEQVFKETAPVLQKLNRTGALLTGKLAMVELAGGGGYRYPSASLQGPGLNPWDRTRWAGGSSSGSGAAVAAGLVPFALGSETSGSILTPCAFCGVTGLRPTYGLVSRRGAMALSWTLDKIGPIARTAEDCGHILDTIAGSDTDDPGSARRGFHFMPEYARPLEDLRIGFAPVDFAEFADEPLRGPLGLALEFFRTSCAIAKEAELPDLPYSALVSTIIGAEAATIFADILADGRVDQLADARQIAGLKAGASISATQYLTAMRIRRQVQAAFRQLFMDFDVLISPARYSTAPKIDEPLDRSSDSSGTNSKRGFRGLIPAGNLAGLPALVLPAGFANGLPVAISLVGRAFSENTLLRAGLDFQRATNFHKARPPI